MAPSPDWGSLHPPGWAIRARKPCGYRCAPCGYPAAVSESVSTQAVSPWSIPLSDVLVDDELLRGGPRDPRVRLVEHGTRGSRPSSRSSRQLCGTRTRVRGRERNGRAAPRAAGRRLRPGRRGRAALAQLRRGREHRCAHRRGAGLLRRGRRARPQPRSERPRGGPEPSAPGLSSCCTTAGHPVRDRRLSLELCQARGIAVVEDAAHAVGATRRGRACGGVRRRRAASASSRTRTSRWAREA